MERRVARFGALDLALDPASIVDRLAETGSDRSCQILGIEEIVEVVAARAATTGEAEAGQDFLLGG